MFFTLSLNSICQAQNYCETLINKYDYYLDKTNNSKTRTLTWSDGYLITKQNDTIYGEILKLPDVVTLKEPYKNDYSENNLGLTRIKLRNNNIDEKKFKADEVKLFVVDNETYRSIKPKDFSIFVREKIIGSLCYSLLNVIRKTCQAIMCKLLLKMNIFIQMIMISTTG